jgi:hypothetical protein
MIILLMLVRVLGSALADEGHVRQQRCVSAFVLQLSADSKCPALHLVCIGSCMPSGTWLGLPLL